MENPLISIIVPVYKVEKYLDRCIESIVNQTYRNLEIILVDDGSPDTCPQMCDEWAKKDSRIKVIRKENGGLSSARNVGLDIATGDYVGFVDSDDYVELNMYEVLASKSNGEDIIRCLFYNSYPNGNEETVGNVTNEYYRVNVSEIRRNSLIYDFCSVWCGIYKRSAINNLRFDKTIKMGEDLPFNYLANAQSQSKIFIGEYLYHYRIDAASLSHDLKSENVACKLKPIEDIYKNELSLQSADDEVNSWYINMLFSTLYELVLSKGEKRQYIHAAKRQLREFLKDDFAEKISSQSAKNKLKIFSFLFCMPAFKYACIRKNKKRMRKNCEKSIKRGKLWIQQQSA